METYVIIATMSGYSELEICDDDSEGCHTKQKENCIDDLPPELLVRIFSFYVKSEGHRKFLKNIPLVCKRWNEISSIPSLWKDIMTDDWKYDEIVKLGERGLLSSARKLLNLPGALDCTQILHLLRYYPCLQELNLCLKSVPTALMETLLQRCPDIQSLNFYLTVPEDFHFIPDVFGPFLSVRGPNLKTIALSHVFLLRNDTLVSTIAEHCHSLEQLHFCFTFLSIGGDDPDYLDYSAARAQIPIDKIMIGCPKLRVFGITCVDIMFFDVSTIREGFNDLVDFYADEVDFNGMYLRSILKNAKNLKSFTLHDCRNLKLDRMSMIASDKIEKVTIVGEKLGKSNLKSLEGIMSKWKRTLTSLVLVGFKLDLTAVLETYLHLNPYPRLKRMSVMGNDVNTSTLKKVMQQCKNLSDVRFNDRIFTNRREVEDFCA